MLSNIISLFERLIFYIINDEVVPLKSNKSFLVVVLSFKVILLKLNFGVIKVERQEISL